MAWINEKNLYVDMYNSPEPLLLISCTIYLSIKTFTTLGLR